ncbi:hypothetical protein MA16_Dca011849 [Dendrobium catenatum]|uniref:Uncharacterized protein n=1 Tax=Dendrobium catenatum TaxID=906689 RepID=A0A2I0WEB0_9ASPA|nr:hypothetical protein MA16_Dca013493 [Dendrobium catenatum]PKU73993.1 hypothetical protein MA16_Dca011849 [Dendrobium catenatum]
MVGVTYTGLFGLKDRSRQETVVGRRPGSVGDWGLKDRCLVMEVGRTVVGDEGLKDRRQ